MLPKTRPYWNFCYLEDGDVTNDFHFNYSSHETSVYLVQPLPFFLPFLQGTDGSPPKCGWIFLVIIATRWRAHFNES